MEANKLSEGEHPVSKGHISFFRIDAGRRLIYLEKINLMRNKNKHYEWL
jgi:hypothetical protein